MQADQSTSAENEWLCLQIARAYGLDAARCDIVSTYPVMGHGTNQITPENARMAKIDMVMPG